MLIGEDLPELEKQGTGRMDWYMKWVVLSTQRITDTLNGVYVYDIIKYKRQ